MVQKTAKALGAGEIARKAAAVLFSKKAEDAVLLDLRGLSNLTDYFLICTCRNEPHMRAVLGAAARALSREGVKARSEYHPGARWAVLDFGDLIVHLFEKHTRGFYSLERLWGDAKSLRLRPEDFAPPEKDPEDADGDL
jgi:ribosome-associated protein